jgi:predicted kinase
MDNILVMMQGPSGSGKSTLASHLKRLLEACGYTVCICSTDDQHIIDGVYRFQPEKLTTFHAINLRLATEALERGEVVIVDNTNLACWEAKPYVQVAVRLGIPVTFHRAEGNFQNVHGVPADKVAQMKSRLEPLTVEGCLAAKAPWEK